MDNSPNSKNIIKDIHSIEQLLSSYLIADAIIEIREERKEQLMLDAENSIPELNTKDPELQNIYKSFAKLVGFRYPFVYMAKIGLEAVEEYQFEKDPSVITNAQNDTSHLSKTFGTTFSMLSQINLKEHTLSVFTKGIEIGSKKGRVMQVAIPILGCLFHDFGKSEKIREELLGNNVGKGYKAHAEVSSIYIKEILSHKYYKLLNEHPMETIDSLANSVRNHHPQRRNTDSGVQLILEADTATRKDEYRRLKNQKK